MIRNVSMVMKQFANRRFNSSYLFIFIVSSPPITSPNANIFQFETIPESAVDNESGSGDSSHAQTKPIPVSRGSVLPKTPMHTGNFSAPAPVSYMTGGRRGSSQFMETSNLLFLYKFLILSYRGFILLLLLLISESNILVLFSVIFINLGVV